MFKPIALAQRWVESLAALPETGMGYQVVSVFLADGGKFEQIVIDSGHITRVRGHKEVPFAETEIAEKQVTHDKCNWEEEPGGSQKKLKGP
jgi:hypothetical protein